MAIYQAPAAPPSLGESLGQSLAQTLQMLTQQKMLQQQQRQQMEMAQMMRQQRVGEVSSALEALGVPLEYSSKIAFLPEKQQEMFLSQFFGSEAFGAPKQPGLGQQLQGMAPEGTMQPGMFPQAGMVEQAGMAPPEAAMPQPTFQQRLRTPRMTPERQDKIDQKTQGFFDKTLLDAKDARETKMRLGRMEELNEKGDLGSPFLYSVLQRFGLDFPVLLSPDSQEFDKLSKDFLKQAKSIFGSRVTEGEIKLFLKTIPTLNQTKEGRRRVIRNMRMFSEAADIKKKAMVDIINKGGRRPANLQMLVEQRTRKKLDNLAKKFPVAPVGPKRKKPGKQQRSKFLGLEF